MNDKELREAIQNRYGAVARSGLSNDSVSVRSIAQTFGYSEEDLASLPPQANMGLSCGNPIAIAALRTGEIVLDLGCGGGLDVLLAAKQVGPKGKAIGVDMTPDMITRARKGAAQVGATNVEFHLAQIDQLPISDATVDCVISNCVINLVPDKAKVFAEIFRVLKPGGRVAISDIALRQPLPPEVAVDLEAYVGCISGALLIADYEQMLLGAGFEAVMFSDTGADLNAYAEAGSGGCCSASAGTCCSPTEAQSPLHGELARVLQKFDVNAYAASVRIHAIKSAPNHAEPQHSGDRSMTTVQVYDKPMCCSTGVCGPQVDPTLTRFTADLDWLKSQGHQVERFNLAQQPAAFAENCEVRQLLAAEGIGCLPIIMVNGVLMSRAEYQPRATLAAWVGGQTPELLPIIESSAACCGQSKCC